MPACAVCVGKLCLELFIVMTAQEVVGCEALAGMCARLRTHFLSSRRKKVSKERATPLSATLRFATGNLSCDGWAGNRSNSLRSDNRGSLSRPTAATQAHTEGTQVPVLVALRATLHLHCNARRSRASSAAPCAVMRRRVAQGWADQGSRLFEAKPSSSETPPRPSNAACPKLCFGTTHSARFSFGYFSLAKQRKVPRPPGRDPANNHIKNNKKYL
jgi:hypothetical protein